MTTENGATEQTVTADTNYVTEDAESIKADLNAENNPPSPEAPKSEEVVKTNEDDEAEEQRSEKRKRPGRLERENMRLAKEIQEAREKLASFEKNNSQEVSNKSDKPSNDAPPRIQDYDDVLEYTEALADYKVRKALDEFTNKQTESQRQSIKENLIQDYRAREQVVIDANPDYPEAISNMVEDGLVTEKMIAYIREESEIGEQVALHLTKYPNDAAVLAGLDGKDFDKAMWTIESFINNQNKGEFAAVKTTKAPQPITPVRTNAISTKDPSDMDYEDYRIARLERRKKQGLE